MWKAVLIFLFVGILTFFSSLFVYVLFKGYIKIDTVPDYDEIYQISQVKVYYDMICYPEQYDRMTEEKRIEIIKWVLEDFKVPEERIKDVWLRNFVSRVKSYELYLEEKRKCELERLQIFTSPISNQNTVKTITPKVNSKK